MNEQSHTGDNREAMSSTDLAFERTMLAHERTLMAWVRTDISMISFGFTIYKFFHEANREGDNTILTPRIVGMVMISFGLLSLILAQMQHQVAMKKIKHNYPAVPKSFSPVIGILVLVFGLTLFLGALFRQ